MSDVSLIEVEKQYEGSATPTIKCLSLQIESGTMVALVGPSGCGKSTTLRMVAGLEEVSGGRIRIGGRDVTCLPPAERNIAMVFQSYALYPHMTVFENMAFGLRIRKLPEAAIAERVRTAAATLDLEPYLQRLPKALSGGQRQRVAIGRAVVREPEVFLFDEPLSNLDAKLRGEMRREIARLHHRTRTTSLYVTHDQVEAMTLADRIVVLKDGVVQQQGSPTDIYRTPANRFVASFIGTPSMNFFQAEVSEAAPPFRDRGQFVARANGLEVPISVSGPSRHVVVGIRPEGLSLTKRDGDIEIRGAIAARELLGPETVLYVDAEAGPLTVRASAENMVRPGEAITLWMAPSAIHVFDATTELRL